MIARINSDVREWTYRHYIANSLKWGAEGIYYEDTLYTIMNSEPQKAQTAEEITAEVIKKTGIKLID